MEIDRTGKGPINIRLTRDEVFRLKDENQTIGERTISGSKIEVSPLSDIEDDDSEQYEWTLDRLEKALKSKAKAYLYPNQDIHIFIPKIKLLDVRIARTFVERDGFETPLSQGKDSEGLIGTLPEEGVIVHFGGSLKVIDIPSAYIALTDSAD